MAMRFLRSFAIVMLGPIAAVAVDTPVSVGSQQQFDRITPLESNAADAGIMSTREVAPQPAMPPGISPFQRAQPMDDSGPVNATTNAGAGASHVPPAPAKFMGKVPFGRAEPAPVIPNGPHTTVSVPVVDVQALDAPEAEPPTPIAPEADPAQEDPAEPTELTSPIFVEEEGSVQPRKIILRALNKVTAQSAVLNLKPNETVKFGQLEITAVTCRTSSPTSQTDYAALLDISEKLPMKDKKEDLKPLFRGWMYASSPSITALEHPVYDVTMVKCDIASAAPKKDEKADAKPAKKAKN